MSCPEISGLVENILSIINDEGAAVYPSGRVENIIFRSIPQLNGLMGSDFSGVSGCITPSISGTVYQPILEGLVSIDLTKKALYAASRNYSITDIREGDSVVKVADTSKNLTALYETLSKQFNELVRQTKFTLASAAPCAIQGTDVSSGATTTPVIIQPYRW